jgi:DNA polymerase III subunit gamma/tau
MSYLVLARKSRPQDFTQVVGQIPVVKTLRNSLVRKRVAHAILFSGVRGVGKTTLARIMAKAINCENLVDGNPCCNCSSCIEIKKGAALDLYEIDGASNRGIQEIRELKEKIKFLPSSAKFKIIIIDEVHMLTTEAFNALLKTLEEPPAHVHFMFATTELHKIPITILSRCQRYELKRIAAPELHTHFAGLCKDEGIEMDGAALDLIVRESEGSVRDGLSLLDQVFSYGEKKIVVADVIEVLGLVSRDIVHTIVTALLSGDAKDAFLALDKTFDFGVDLKRFTTDLLTAFRTLILCRIDGCQKLIDIPQQELDFFQGIAKQYSHNTLHMKLNLLMNGVEEMRYAAQPRLSLESTFLKIIQADDVVPVSSLLAKLDTLLQNNTAPQKSVSEETISKKKTPEINTEKLTVPPPSPATVSEEPPLPEEPDAPPVKDKPQATKEPTKHKNLVPHPHQHDVRKDWLEFIAHVKDRKIWMAQDLQRADKAREIDGELQLHYSDHNNCSVLRQKENVKLLTEFILDFFQKDLTLHFITPVKSETKEIDSADSPHRLRQKLANDPLVLMATEIFSGQIGDIRVGPRSR